MAGAGRRHSRALRRGRVAVTVGALRPRQAHAQPALVARGRGGGPAGDVRRRRRGRLAGSWRLGRRSHPVRELHRGGADRAPALHRRGAPPDRGARRRAAPAALAVAAGRHQLAGAGARIVLAQASGRAAVAGTERSGGAVHVRRPVRRALHDLLLARAGAAHGVALQHRRSGGGGALGRGRDRLRGERPGRSRAVSPCPCADRTACRRATSSSAPRARRRRLPAV